MDFFRKMVSGDKRRYVTDKYNLDLTYITDRVIAMAFPATGMEAAYRNDGTQVANLFKEKHPGHFCVYNLTERKYDTTMFEGRVHDCGWHDHHAPPMAQLFEIVEHIHNFLLRDRDNVVAIHCLAGKGRTGTVIVSYLLYSGLFHDPDEAALFFALRRSNNNWGVTGPSQQRYIRYFWEILRTKKAPTMNTPLRLVSVNMSGPPRFTVGSKRSFTPIITAVDVSGGLVQQVVWTSRGDRTFTDDNERIVFDLVNGNDALLNPLLLLGDVNFTIEAWGAFGRKSKWARFAFNTGMVINDHEHDAEIVESEEVTEGSASSSNEGHVVDPNHGNPELSRIRSSDGTIIVRFPKTEIDDACSDKRTPDGFVIELVFQRVYTKSWMANNTFLADPNDPVWDRVFTEYRDTNGVACFNPRQDVSLVQIIAAARALTDARSGEPPKMGGWLTKRGHRVKNWKKRWFALHTNTLEYSKSPKSTTPAGVIQLDDIITVQEAEPGECEFQNAFIIYTNWDDYVCYAQNESDMEEWINTLNLTLQLREQKRELSDATIGQLAVSVLDINNVPCDEYYAVVQLGHQQAKAASTGSFGKELIFDIHQHANDAMVIQLWEENTYLPDALIGEIQVVLLDMFQKTPTKPLELIQMYGFRHQITRVKVRIVYRPKALIEAQRTPSLTQSRPGLVQVPLTNGSNTARSNSPARMMSLNSKVITPTELKELIEILDFGLNESLRAPDADHPGSDPVWDWTVSSSLGGVSQPSIPREHRYSAIPRTVDVSLPLYMRPLSLDLGLPPSTSSSAISSIPLSPRSSMPSFAPAHRTTTTLPSSSSAAHISPLSTTSAQTPVDSPSKETREKSPETKVPTVEATQSAPGTNSTDMAIPSVPSNTIHFELAIRATSPPPSEAKLEIASTVRGSGGVSAQVFPPAMRSISPPPPHHHHHHPSNHSAETATQTLSPSKPAMQWVHSQEPQLSPPLSPRGDVSPLNDGTTSPTANQDAQSDTSPRTTSPRPFNDGSAPWVSTIAPSETVLEPFVEETTGGSKTMQSLGNVARDRRRRDRRPTYDSQHPPEFIGMEKMSPLTSSNSSRDLTANGDQIPTTSANTPETSNAANASKTS